MLISFYKSDRLKYASRKRYKYIDPQNEEFLGVEEYRNVNFGDGASCSIKAKQDYINADYVEMVMDGVTQTITRWFVVSHTYLNGRQVILNLQRDVIGEFGLASMFGKIERGYTDGILKYRKELSLNEVLKKRVPLLPTTNVRGNYTISKPETENEMWGILYFTKPSNGENPTINIPSFAPKTADLPFIDANTTYRYNIDNYVEQRFVFRVEDINNNIFYIEATQAFNYVNNSWKVQYRDANILSQNTGNYDISFRVDRPVGYAEETLISVVYGVLNRFSSDVISGSVAGFKFPNVPVENRYQYNYGGKIIESGGKFYEYSEVTGDTYNYGTINYDLFNSYINGIGSFSFSIDGYTYNISALGVKEKVNYTYDLISRCIFTETNFIPRELSPSESGSIIIDTTKQLVDEPYFIMAFPLFNCTITRTNDSNENYSIDKSNAFMVFNEVIQYLSGQASILVDAQIYPYCPFILDKQSEIVHQDTSTSYPFFSIQSTSYFTECEVQPLPYSDVKKEYITRNYSIVSPDKSDKFIFSFYDFNRKVTDVNGKNQEKLTITIKTALKPFAIISSAVIKRVPDATGRLPIEGINYESELSGCMPSSAGFECSLASNAFEQYKRQNSNYQQLFGLEKEYLQKQQTVERVNEATQGVFNTLTMTAFGAMAGRDIASVSELFDISGVAGAAAGASAFGGATAIANVVQYAANENLREYERNLQQTKFDLQIGTIKNLPISINRISSFNEIIMKDFYYVLETYECTDDELFIVDSFINKYGYGIGVFDLVINYYKSGWFIKANLVSSNLDTNLHNIAAKELTGGIYYYG